jgi:hypothetical protein
MKPFTVHTQVDIDNKTLGADGFPTNNSMTPSPPFPYLFQPYFCGQHNECMVAGSTWALQRAKENIDRWFPVVAVLERMTQSMEVLEQFIPTFFKGAVKIYNYQLKSKIIKVNGIVHYLNVRLFFQNRTRIGVRGNSAFLTVSRPCWPPISL